MAFPNIALRRGTTLNPILFVLYDDVEKTERTDVFGSLPVALVKNSKGVLVVDLAPTIELAADYPELDDAAGDPMPGYIIVITMTDEASAALEVGVHKWDLVNEYDNGQKQYITGGDFNIQTSKSLS